MASNSYIIRTNGGAKVKINGQVFAPGVYAPGHPLYAAIDKAYHAKHQLVKLFDKKTAPVEVKTDGK